MQSHLNIWNFLHDGCIIGFSGQCPGEISLKVEIEYLCKALDSDSKFLRLNLHSCSSLLYAPFTSSDVVKDLVQLEKLELEILNAKETGKDTVICCTEGILSVNYLDVTCTLNNGVLVSLSTLFQASKKYWDD